MEYQTSCPHKGVQEVKISWLCIDARCASLWCSNVHIFITISTIRKLRLTKSHYDFLTLQTSSRKKYRPPIETNHIGHGHCMQKCVLVAFAFIRSKIAISRNRYSKRQTAILEIRATSVELCKFGKYPTKITISNIFFLGHGVYELSAQLVLSW